MPDDFERRVATSGAVVNLKEILLEVKNLVQNGGNENREILKGMARMELKQDDFKDSMKTVVAISDAHAKRLQDVENKLASTKSEEYQKECDEERKQHGQAIANLNWWMNIIIYVVLGLFSVAALIITVAPSYMKH